MSKSYDQESMLKLLKRAQDTYGNANQMSVVTEECCELGQVSAKYSRYPDHKSFCESMYKGKTLREHIIEEVGDVIVCLNHLMGMFEITNEELDATINPKLERLEGWLDASNSMYQTTIDREVNTTRIFVDKKYRKPKVVKSCKHQGTPYEEECARCDGNLPCKEVSKDATGTKEV